MRNLTLRSAAALVAAFLLAGGASAAPAAPAAAPVAKAPATTAAPAKAPATAAAPAKPAPAATPATPAPAPAPAVDTAKFPSVVARVNGFELTKVLLLNQASSLLQQGQEPTLEFYRAVVDQMIGTRLLYDDSVARKLSATDEDVEKMFSTMRQRFAGSDDDFAAKVKESGLTIPEIKQGIRENLSIRGLVTKEIGPSVVVNEADEQKFYDENPQRMQRPEQVELSHILIALKPGGTDAEKAADKAAAKKKAEDILAKIKAGGDMAQLAKENSEDGSKDKGGALGWISKGQTVPPFEAAAFALQPGETSGVVESQFGFHIIRCTGRRPAGKAPFADVKEQIASFLHDRGLAEAVRKHVAELRAKAKIEVLI